MPSLWGLDRHGKKVYRYTLKNAQGTEVSIINYGAIIQSLRIASPFFGPTNVVLSYPHLMQYLKDQHFIGAVVGRYGNRISESQFDLNGKTIRLPANNTPHHLHGGPEGFYRKTWDIISVDTNRIDLRLISEDGDQGYPGTLTVDASYSLDDEDRLRFAWRATSSEDTVVNLSNHSYFNLAGFGDIRNHKLRIPCQYYTPLREDGIPLGKVEPVKNTFFDFCEYKKLHHILNELDGELEPFGGVDHNWVSSTQSNKKQHNQLAQLICEESGIRLDVQSTLPGLQCYTGNHLAKSGVFGSFEGICLETQYFPDSPNRPNFPQPIVKAGETIAHETIFQFSKIAEHIADQAG